MVLVLNTKLWNSLTPHTKILLRAKRGNKAINRMMARLNIPPPPIAKACGST